MKSIISYSVLAALLTVAACTKKDTGIIQVEGMNNIELQSYDVQEYTYNFSGTSQTTGNYVSGIPENVQVVLDPAGVRNPPYTRKLHLISRNAPAGTYTVKIITTDQTGNDILDVYPITVKVAPFPKERCEEFFHLRYTDNGKAAIQDTTVPLQLTDDVGVSIAADGRVYFNKLVLNYFVDLTGVERTLSVEPVYFFIECNTGSLVIPKQLVLGDDGRAYNIWGKAGATDFERGTFRISYTAQPGADNNFGPARSLKLQGTF